MSVRPEVRALVAYGPLPDSESAEEQQLEEIQRTMEEISRPVSDEEARLLVTIFGPDECYGLGWSLLHLIETAPGEMPFDELPKAVRENEWAQRLAKSAARAKRGD